MIKESKIRRIRVFGPCGSGKSFLANNLAKTSGINHHETDNMIWNRQDNMKYSKEERNENLDKIMTSESWIIEGAQYKWSFESFVVADVIIFIDPNPVKLFWRVISRFLRMQFNSKCFNYKQSLKELIEMLVQNNEYFRTTKYDFLNTMEDVKTEIIVLRDSSLNLINRDMGNRYFDYNMITAHNATSEQRSTEDERNCV